MSCAFIHATFPPAYSFMVVHGFGQVAAVTKIQSVHRATQIRIIYHEVVAAVRRVARGPMAGHYRGQ